MKALKAKPKAEPQEGFAAIKPKEDPEPPLLALRLKTWEFAEIRDAPVKGGQLSLKTKLLEKFAYDEANKIHAIEMTDELTGHVFRHMAGNKGDGGWQRRLAAAFLPAIRRATGTV